MRLSSAWHGDMAREFRALAWRMISPSYERISTILETLFYLGEDCGVTFEKYWIGPRSI